jgi:hypothetical protein
MGLLDTVNGILGGALGGLQPKAAAENSRVPGRRSYLGVTDGDAAFDTVAEVIALITGVAHTEFFKIWQKTVPAQQLISWGYGTPALQRNQGFMWFAALDSGTDWDVGILRIEQSKARGYNNRIVAEIPDGQLHTTTVTTIITAKPTEIDGQMPFPEQTQFPYIGEDSLMVLSYALLTAATAHDAVGFDIPITIYEGS